MVVGAVDVVAIDLVDVRANNEDLWGARHGGYERPLLSAMIVKTRWHNCPNLGRFALGLNCV